VVAGTAAPAAARSMDLLPWRCLELSIDCLRSL
jgi:hypothetical protein